MALQPFIERYSALVRAELAASLEQVEAAALRQAMGHLLGRGKLLRPLIVLAAYEACGGGDDTGVGAEQRSARDSRRDEEDGRSIAPPLREAGGTSAAPTASGQDAREPCGQDVRAPMSALPGARATADMVPFAAPFELVHTFTLIHDDLPCMDDAATRRGVAAVHVLSGEATAVLAGDALLNLAFARLAAAGCGISDAQRMALIAAAARATGLVVEGQVLDMESEQQQLSVAELKALHNKKTGALMAACCQAGAILAGAPAEVRNGLWDWGVQLGLVFQIRDDLLSVTGDEALVGKPLRLDEAAGKATYPRLLGLAAAGTMLHAELTRCKTILADVGLPRPDLLLELAELAAGRDH